MPVLNWRCVDVLLLYVVKALKAFDVVSDKFYEYRRDLCV